MFDFSILITILIAILIFYFTLYITLNKEIGDLSSSSEKSIENEPKINNRKGKIKFLNIITVILVIIVIVLYMLPYIITLLKNFDLSDFDPVSFSDIGKFLMKLVPFKKGFFSDFNFTYSFVTESILAIFTYVLYLWILIDENDLTFHPIIVISFLLTAFILIWVNNYVSLFLTYCIIHCFLFLSLIFNICLYVVILIILFLIYQLIDYLW